MPPISLINIANFPSCCCVHISAPEVIIRILKAFQYSKCIGIIVEMTQSLANLDKRIPYSCILLDKYQDLAP